MRVCSRQGRWRAGSRSLGNQGIWKASNGRRSGKAVALAMVSTVTLAASAIHPQVAAASAPTCDEYALLAYANQARAAQNLTPLIWSDAIGEAAREHSDDVTAHGCLQHDSCDGEAWWHRIQRYYPGWSMLAENIAGGGSDPRLVHNGWMASPGHRGNILGAYSEFGAGISVAPPSEGSWSYSTEDFGTRGPIPLSSIPTLPAGGVVPRLHYESQPRDLVVNYYDPGGGAPSAVRALVGSSCVNLTRIAGSASNGTYGTTRTFSDLCTPVVFEAIRSDGSRHRWPENEAIVVGVGTASVTCPELTAVVPTQDCGGGGGPLPTPTPAPGGAGADLDNVRVVLKPSNASPIEASVQVQATLPALADFDPTSGPISLELTFGGSGDWSVDLPSVCEDAPCLTPNRQTTSYRARYDTARALSFVLGSNGRWKVRFSARDQAVGTLEPGPLTLRVTVDGQTFTASAEGELRGSGLLVVN